MNERTTRLSEDIHIRHAKRQQERRRAMKRRRITFFTVLAIIVLSVILFFTPIFNIRKIEIMGNTRIETPQIKQAVGSVEQENLFRVSAKKIKEDIKKIPYIDDVDIEKSIFPVGLKINVLECQPIGYIVYNEQYVILDKNMKVLEILESPMEGLAEILGVTTVGATPGSIIASEDAQKLLEISECIGILIDEEIMQNTNSVAFTDINNITLTYENRLDIVCGSSLDFSDKIKMLKKALNSNTLTANSRGTINLSISGKAVYTP